MIALSTLVYVPRHIGKPYGSENTLYLFLQCMAQRILLPTLMNDYSFLTSFSELAAIYFPDEGFLSGVRMSLRIVLTCLSQCLRLINFNYIYCLFVFLLVNYFCSSLAIFDVYLYSSLYILGINLLFMNTWQRLSPILRAVCPLT